MKRVLMAATVLSVFAGTPALAHASKRRRISRLGGWAGLKKLRNTLGLVHPLCCTGGETVIFIRGATGAASHLFLGITTAYVW